MSNRRNIVITGASSGLGEGMARRFAALGRNLALCARRTDRLDTLAAQLRAEYPGIDVHTRALDVNDHEQVFEVLEKFRGDLGTIDRVIVNAGIGKGQPIGSGRFDANLQTVQTNLVAALAQCEAAMSIFREQNHGHLVVVSSFSALRGLPGNVTAYAASKAGSAVLAEGIRSETHGTPISVTTLLPGFISSEMTAGNKSPMLAKADTGAKALVKAIEKERAKAYVPTLPWAPLSLVMRHAPLSVLGRFV